MYIELSFEEVNRRICRNISPGKTVPDRSATPGEAAPKVLSSMLSRLR